MPRPAKCWTCPIRPVRTTWATPAKCSIRTQYKLRFQEIQVNIHPAGGHVHPGGNSIQDISLAVQGAKLVGEGNIRHAISQGMFVPSQGMPIHLFSRLPPSLFLFFVSIFSYFFSSSVSSEAMRRRKERSGK